MKSSKVREQYKLSIPFLSEDEPIEFDVCSHPYPMTVLGFDIRDASHVIRIVTDVVTFTTRHAKYGDISAVRIVNNGIICQLSVSKNTQSKKPWVVLKYCAFSGKTICETSLSSPGVIHGPQIWYDGHGRIDAAKTSLYINGQSYSERLRRMGISDITNLTDPQRTMIKLTFDIDL